MTIDERIAWAKKQRNIAYKKDSVQGIVYWDGYLDALKAVKDYHKASEVAREIFEVLDKHTENLNYYTGNFEVYYKDYLALKKKYTEEGK